MNMQIVFNKVATRHLFGTIIDDRLYSVWLLITFNRLYGAWLLIRFDGLS